MFFAKSAIGADVRIRSADDFIQFKENVNSGVDRFERTAVFLESDIDFDGETLEPIGREWGYQFLGVFDGQGHAISNLIMNSSSYYSGLFGYSAGLTIKNVILDSSCSITSSISDSSSAYIGGIIGICQAENGPCTIENSVNMGSVTFSGDRSGNYLYLGGIAGYFSSSYYIKYEATMKNCANYGDVTHSGKSDSSYIGGIVGDSSGSSESNKRVYIYNCLNHGTIMFNGTSYTLNLGGIVGTAYFTTIENCVSGGKISMIAWASRNNYTGSIVGRVYSRTSISYTYFTSDLSGYSKYGDGTPSSETNTFSYDSTSFELDGTVSIGSYTGNSLIGALNAAADSYTLRDYSHWLLNKENKGVSFTINENSPFTLNAQVILLPSLASEGKLWFDGWYADDGLTTLLTKFEVTSDTELYGRTEKNTNNYTISFVTRGGTPVEPITAQFGTVLALKNISSKERYALTFLETEYGDKVSRDFTVPAHNITLYAVWILNRIATVDEFVIFSENVNSGMNYSGITVFLESDIDFAGKSFEPIGNSSEYFINVFDGQGHVISNLAMNSSLEYVGLFGYSEGLTIKNVILDSSCSVTSSISGYDDAFIGGIIGGCNARYGRCTIENSVNMGSATFTGNTYGYLRLGGIIGLLDTSSGIYDSTVKNCANYGDVTDSGKSGYSWIGGIAGYSDGSFIGAYIYNSLNHGTITHKGATTTYKLYLGGIAGYTFCTTIDNCVSDGKISLLTTASGNNYIGSIVGDVYSYTSINYAYFTSDLSDYNKYGYNDSTSTSESNTTSYNSITFELNETVSIRNYTGTFLIETLNAYTDYYTFRDYSRWLLNKENKAVTFTINGRTNPIKMDTQVILLPSLASKGKASFDGWYNDKGCTVPFERTAVEEDTTLYGKYGGDSKYESGSKHESGHESDSSNPSFSLPLALSPILLLLLNILI